MENKKRNSQLKLELILILITFSLVCLLFKTASHKFTVLNLFYLPVVLAGFFLGRYRAGILALLAVLSATPVIILDIGGFAPNISPIETILAIMIWGTVLGLTALLVGSLNDDRNTKAVEAREAQVGVAEVLAQYLQSANPNLRNRAARVVDLSAKVAKKMRLSEKEIDDIRVAALLMDIENIEITSRVIKRAVGALEEDCDQHTVHGTELVQSLGSVLTSAFPLLLNQTEGTEINNSSLPFGAHILRTVRKFDELVHSVWENTPEANVENALDDLKNDIDADHHPAILHALEEVLVDQEYCSTQIESEHSELFE